MAKELRGDIQGLRAVAVLFVIAAHAGVPFLPGGFVGVDVFYVISGYLIAGLLYREVLLTGQVSLGAFWARRARRILPAATLVTVVHRRRLAGVDEPARRPAGRRSTRCGPRRSPRTSTSPSRASTTSPRTPAPRRSSTTGRWRSRSSSTSCGRCCSSAASRSPPARAGAAAVGSSGCPAAPCSRCCVVISLASLAWSIHQTVGSPTTAYFSTFTRAWELGVGALIALVPPSAVRRLTRLASRRWRSPAR